MINQTTYLIQVVKSKLRIRNAQKKMESIGTIGTNGHLNFLSIFGDVLRKTKIDTDTNMNATKVPILTISDNVSIENKAPNKPAEIPNIHVAINGVLVLLLIIEKILGTSPSLDIAYAILVWPYNMTNKTVVIPSIAPTSITPDIQF